MAGIEISGAVAVFLGALGAVWIYLDSREQGIETADMWATGFFIGMFIPPIIGAVIVGVLYIQKRNPRKGIPHLTRQCR